jgi:uncharacterized protein YjbI with pentapeptide repeats
MGSLMTSREKIVAIVIGAALGAIALDRTLWLLIGYQRYFGELSDFVIRLLVGGLLGGVSAILFGELAAGYVGKKYNWFFVLLGCLLVPVILGSIYGFSQRQTDFKAEEEYEITKNWDKQKSLHGFNLSGKDMHGSLLTGADLSSADLRGANLSFARLSASDLTGADLTAANLRGAHLNEADLSEADLSGADLSFAGLIGANLNGASLIGTKYDSATKWPEDFDFRHSGAIGPSADFRGSKQYGEWFYNVDLTGADFSAADMRKSVLRGSNLQGADLSGTDLSGAELSTANLEGANLNLARYTIDTSWPENFDPKAAGAILVDDRGNPIEKTE